MKAILLCVAVMALAVLAVAGPADNEAITLPSTAPKDKLQKAIVIQAPPHPSHARKHRGNFSVRPLLDNGKEFLKAHIPRKYKLDECTGCVVPVKVHPKLDPRNRLDAKGNVVGKKKVLPVEPELRDRTPRRRFSKKKAAAPKPQHRRPEFYPLTRKQRKAVKKPEHHSKVIKRLPNIPEFYPAPKPKRLFNPPEGWPCENCDKKKL